MLKYNLLKELNNHYKNFKFINLYNCLIQKNYIDKHLKHIIDVYIFLYCSQDLSHHKYSFSL